MVKMSKDTQGRVMTVVKFAQKTFHWGFVPVVLYLGFKKGTEPDMPPLSIFNIFW